MHCAVATGSTQSSIPFPAAAPVAASPLDSFAVAMDAVLAATMAAADGGADAAATVPAILTPLAEAPVAAGAGDVAPMTASLNEIALPVAVSVARPAEVALPAEPAMLPEPVPARAAVVAGDPDPDLTPAPAPAPGPAPIPASESASVQGAGVAAAAAPGTVTGVNDVPVTIHPLAASPAVAPTADAVCGADQPAAAVASVPVLADTLPPVPQPVGRPMLETEPKEAAAIVLLAEPPRTDHAVPNAARPRLQLAAGRGVDGAAAARLLAQPHAMMPTALPGVLAAQVIAPPAVPVSNSDGELSAAPTSAPDTEHGDSEAASADPIPVPAVLIAAEAPQAPEIPVNSSIAIVATTPPPVDRPSEPPVITEPAKAERVLSATASPGAMAIASVAPLRPAVTSDVENDVSAPAEAEGGAARRPAPRADADDGADPVSAAPLALPQNARADAALAAAASAAVMPDRTAPRATAVADNGRAAVRGVAKAGSPASVATQVPQSAVADLSLNNRLVPPPVSDPSLPDEKITQAAASEAKLPDAVQDRGATPATPAFDSAPRQIPASMDAKPVTAPAPAAPVFTARATQIGHDVGVAIAHRLSAGGDELVVRLVPAELGRIEVRMSFDERSGLRAMIAADSPIALDLLRRDSADLSRALSDAGVRSDSQSLRFQNDGSNGGGQQQGSAANQQRSPWRDADANAGRGLNDGGDDATPIAYRPIRTSGSYNLLA